MSRKKSIVEKELSNLTIGGKIVMAVMLPIFAVVAGVEHIIAKLTGSTYNEVNIIVYYLLIPLSWTVMIDYLTKFLLWFKRIGWNYVVSSVIICVIIPILVYVELIYAIIKSN